ncbi:MAG: hypothetical protein US62_C0007G0027 [Candidatus Woesebacteria bacterium GW2011_GWA1_37_8]|uniref:SCP domain-containing protein n=1 Tax=Candidatus Woesebacteria bacterium GW2011_GWA1_37_8 TaxID=1618546 RepID=A0A0G0HUJ3_9BACT|nr:MAG: hypothetical protein US62_C0007G0027 [Candidatus Woesebacteria bacterium GW2011_GWA1_37_8]
MATKTQSVDQGEGTTERTKKETAPQSSVVDIIISVFTKVVFLLIVFALFIIIYFFGLIKGYDLAKNDADATIAQIISEYANKLAMTQDGGQIPTPTIIPTKVPQAVKTKITWGGPDLWNAVNKRRVELGVNPLNTRSELCTIASIRLNELLDLGKLDGHEGFSNMKERRPDTEWIFNKYGTVAEFLAVGGDTATETVSMWENTLGHSQLLKGGEYVWGCIYAQDSLAVAITAY